MGKSRLENGFRFILSILLLVFLAAGFSCSKTSGQKSSGHLSSDPLSGESNEAELPDLAETVTRISRETADPDREAFVEDFWRWICGEAGLPEQLARKIAASVLQSPAFIMELLQVLQQDAYTFYLVDKQRALPDGYEPDDLVSLSAGSYRLGRDGLTLRRIAAEALEEMAAAAAADGITLTVGSAYRSAEYQAQVYAREVQNYGKETADRQSAQSGKSQHQLGLTADFAPIDDTFASTPASRWLLRNASRFGWSLSFPENYGEITGYRWESWHYRFVGKDLAAFINNYFDGIQQYALQFIYAWQQQAE